MKLNNNNKNNNYNIVDKFFSILKRAYSKLISNCKNSGPVWKIPIICMIVLYAIIAFAAGLDVGFGFGRIVDAVIFEGLALLLLIALIGVIYFIIPFIINLPKYFLAVMLSFLIIGTTAINQSIGLSDEESFIMTIIVLIVEIVLGTALYLIIKKNKKLLGTILLAITIILNAVGTYWFVSEGFFYKQEDIISNNSNRKILEAENPAETGEYLVGTLTYGSGKSSRRKEFGEDADIITRTVNARTMLGETKGFNGRMRKLYWGFDERSLPLNAKVWYPEAKGKFPLVLVVHGNHTMQFSSDTGYEYLCKLLASQGFIAVSVDENFLNGSWSGGLNSENDARAWLLLEHIKQWNIWNSDKKSVFYKKIDMDNIALIGHSRGGEAVSIAAAFNKLNYYPNDGDLRFNYDYNIKAIAAIAPTDGQYKPTGKFVPLENIDYLVIQGSNDGDVSSFYGSRQYNRVSFNDDTYHFKSSLYISGANHGQFNTSWGRRDLSFPSGMLLNVKPLLKGEDQRAIAKVYISAFLQTTLKGKDEYLPMFKNNEYALKWMPKTVYMNRFSDSNYKTTICNYEEDIDIGTTTIKEGKITDQNIFFWREKEIKLRDNSHTENSAVYLQWKNSKQKEEKIGFDSIYKITLPNNSDEYISNKNTLTFSIADTGKYTKKEENHKDLDITLRIIDNNNEMADLSISDYIQLQKAIQVKFTKLKWYEEKYSNEIEPNFQSVFIPLQDFVNSNEKLDLNSLKSIEFVFNLVPSGEVILDDIEIEKGMIW